MRRRHTLSIFAVIMSFAIGACNVQGTPNQAIRTPNMNQSEEVTTIGFAVQEFERAAYEPLVTQFNADNPDMRVQLVSIETLYDFNAEDVSFNEYTRRIVSGADTALFSSVDISVIEPGLLTDLTPHMEADASFDQEDFYPGALDIVSRGNSTYIIPQQIQVPLLAYNKDMWSASGLPQPDLTWSWPDLLATAEQLAQTRGNDVEVYGLLEFGSGSLFLLSELDQTGINPLQTPAEDIQLDDQTIVSALERLETLADMGALFVDHNDQELDIEQATELVLDQRVGMWNADILASSDTPESPPFEIGILPYPYLQLPFGSPAQGLVMSAGTQHPEKAWRWLSFISQQQIDSPFQQTSDITSIPARRSIAEQTGYWDNIDEDTNAAIQAALDIPRTSTTLDYQMLGSLFQTLNTATNRVMSNEQTPGEALRAAQSTFEERLTEINSGQSATPEIGAVIVPTSVPNASAEDTSTIIFNADAGFDTVALRDLADTFNDNNPDLFVEVVSPRSSSELPNISELATSADCFATWGAPHTDELTAIQDIQPLIDTDATFDQEDYPAGLLAPFQQRGGLYGLPSTITLQTLSYNKDAFETAGLEPPNASWTLDDFLNAAQQLTGENDSEQQYGYAAAGFHQVNDLRYFLSQFGAALATNNHTQPNFTDPSVIEASRFYIDLIKASSPHERLIGHMPDDFDNDTFQLLGEGRVGMWLHPFDVIGGPAQDFTIASAPPPLNDHPIDSTSINITGLYISAETTQVDACWHWITYLSRYPLGFTGSFPARVSVAESETFLAQARPGTAEVYTAYREALEQPPVGLSTQDADNVPIDEFWYYRAVDRAIQGEDLEQELVEAQQLTKGYLLCRQNGADAYTCATQVDPDYAGFAQPPDVGANE
ncbi:MAG: extracellular solute-binding protein [Chloroflexota bacterium]